MYTGSSRKKLEEEKDENTLNERKRSKMESVAWVMKTGSLLNGNFIPRKTVVYMEIKILLTIVASYFKCDRRGMVNNYCYLE